MRKDRNEQIVKDIMADFESRRNDRRPFELGFLLDMNFALGNQNSFVSRYGEIEETERNYPWEEREVFNHIAPVVETRLAKLAKVRPTMHVRPASADESDLESARLSSALLSSSSLRARLDEKIAEATLWSEVCGTSFYHIFWRSEAGCAIGETEDHKPIFSGDIEVEVCPPFEIFPDSAGAKDISDCKSLIHAQSVPVDEIKQKFGVEIEPQDIDIFTFDRAGDFAGLSGKSSVQKLVRAKRSGHCLMISRYTMPNATFPLGRLEIVAGDKLLFEGDLPNTSPCGERFLPFVRQISLGNVGCFWGGSVVERCIPLQRAYNLVRNKKHELLSRLAAGVLVVEDGSVDIDNLEEEGLAPGKILVYRAGSTPPKFMDDGSVPAEFTLEENRILDEFVSLSGVSEFSRSSVAPSNVSSGVALGLLVEQDDTRLSQTADYIRFAVREVARQILCNFHQFGSTARLLEVAGSSGEVEAHLFETSHITSDDVVLDTQNEMSESPASRKALVLDLLKNGLLCGPDGKMDERTRGKVLEALGFGSWEVVQGTLELHAKRARRENFGEEDPNVLEIDNHSVHIEEHTKFVLEEGTRGKGKKILEHIAEHKAALAAQNNLGSAGAGAAGGLSAGAAGSAGGLSAGNLGGAVGAGSLGGAL